MSLVDLSGERAKVFIGTPTHICKRYCALGFIKAIDAYAKEATHWIVCNSQGDAASYYLSTKSPRRFYKHLKLTPDHYNHSDSTHRRIVESMNFLRDQFLLERKFEYFLSLEADVLINQDTLDSMLMAARHPSAHVVYSNCYPGFHKHKEPAFVDRMTLGCTLIRRHVLKRLSFRYSSSVLAAYHDTFFAEDCVKEKFPILYEPKIVTTHLNNKSGRRGWDCLPNVETSGVPV